MKTLHLGLDLGGTWLRACLADGRGRVLRRARLPARGWRRLPEMLPALRRRLAFRKLDSLTLGATGLWTPAHKAEARRLLRGWAAKIRPFSDVELAHLAAFAGGPGILVVGGTGSIALARDSRGRARRAGGWGPLLGDDGSGFWIGRAALRDPGLRRRLRLDPLAWAHAAQGARGIAGLAPRILRLARTDPRARRIRDAAAGHLAELAAEAGRGLRFSGPAPVAWWGGLFQDRTLPERFRRALRTAARRQGLALAPPRPPRMPAEVAAAVLRPPYEPAPTAPGTTGCFRHV